MLRYAITDRHLFDGSEADRAAALLAQARRLTAADVEFLQLREKDLAAEDLLALAKRLRAALPAGGRPRLLLNGSLALALKAGADGVHLPGGWSAAAVTAARQEYRRAGWAAVLSVAAHSAQEARAAAEAGVDLILFGPIFAKQVRSEAVAGGVGLEALRAAVRAAGATPVLALGGIDQAAIPACLAAGAAGVAGIRLFLSDQG